MHFRKLNICKPIVALFMMLGATAVAHAAEVTLNLSVMGSNISNYAIQVWAEPCSGSTIYCYATGNTTDYSDEYLCSGITADTNIYMSIANSSGNVTDVQYGYCDDSLGDLTLQYTYIPTGSVSGPTGQCYCSGGGGTGSGSSSSNSDCTYFRTLWNHYLNGGVTVSNACSGAEGWAATACGGTTTDCYAWYKSVDYTSYNSTINDLICYYPDLETEQAAAELGLSCTVEGPASGEIYILANCDTISSSSDYYSMCDGDGSVLCNDYAISIKCHDILGANGYIGARINIDGTLYLACFNSVDHHACLSLSNGCSSDYYVAPSYSISSGTAVSELNQVSNMEQLKCCYNYTASSNEDMGNGITCDTWHMCNSDGSKSVFNRYCRCSSGYYSTQGWTYSDGADALDLMEGVCESCLTTIPSDGANSVSIPPTSNGGGGITSCRLINGTQGQDDKGEYTITDNNCKYSK